METTIEQEIKQAEQRLNELKEKQKSEMEKNNPLNISTLGGIYTKLNCYPSEDVIKVSGLDAKDHEVLKAIADRMRICKVYNNGVLPTTKDRRWFPWSLLNNKAGSGLVFGNSGFVDDGANLSSAPRLSFLTEAGSTKYFENFQEVEEKIIGL